MAAEFIVGALFDIDAAPAIGALERLGAAFSAVADRAATLREAMGLDSLGMGRGEGLLASLDRQIEATTAAASGIGNALATSIERGVSIAEAAIGRLDTRMREIGGLPSGRGESVIQGRETAILPMPREQLTPADSVSGAERPGFFSRGGGQAGSMIAGLVPIGEVAAIVKGSEAAMQEDNALRVSLSEGMHINPGDQNFNASMERLRHLAQEGSRGTIFSEATAAGLMPAIARELGFTGEGGMRLLEQVYRPALLAAEVAKQSGLGGDMHSSMSAGIEYGHLTGATSNPEELTARLDTLRTLAQLTNNTLAGEETILKYSVPIGMAAGMKADDAAILTGFLQQQGFNSSTAGTGLSAVILGLLNTGGPLSAQLTQRRDAGEHEFENALGLKPGQGAAQHGGRGNAHMKALRDLHLIDDHNKSTVFDANDQFQEDKFLKSIRDYRATHTHQETATAFKNLAGDRGERVLMPLSEADAGQKLDRFSDTVHTAPTSVQIQNFLMQGPLNQFEQMLSRISDVGNTLLTPTLEGLNTILKSVNAGLTGFNDFLHEHQGLAKAGGYSALVGGGLAAASLVGWGASKLGRSIMWGPRAIGRGLSSLVGGGGGEGLAAAAGEEAAGGSIMVAGVPLLLLGGGIAAAVASKKYGWMAENNANEFGQPMPYTPFQIPGVGNVPQSLPGPRAGTTPTAAAPPSSPPQVTMTNNINIQGALDDGMIATLIQKITAGLSQAMAHVTGDGHGTLSSVYTFPGGL